MDKFVLVFVIIFCMIIAYLEGSENMRERMEVSDNYVELNTKICGGNNEATNSESTRRTTQGKE